jgi:hypothetical protein
LILKKRETRKKGINMSTEDKGVWVHPELRKGEVFLKNMTKEEFNNRCRYNFKRLGNVAYNWDNKPLDKISPENLFPVFVDEGEYRAKGDQASVFLREPPKEK